MRAGLGEGSLTVHQIGGRPSTISRSLSAETQLVLSISNPPRLLFAAAEGAATRLTGDCLRLDGDGEGEGRGGRPPDLIISAKRCSSIVWAEVEASGELLRVGADDEVADVSTLF